MGAAQTLPSPGAPPGPRALCQRQQRPQRGKSFRTPAALRRRSPVAPATARTSHPAAHGPPVRDLQMRKAEKRRGAPGRRGSAVSRRERGGGAGPGAPVGTRSGRGCPSGRARARRGHGRRCRAAPRASGVFSLAHGPGRGGKGVAGGTLGAEVRRRAAPATRWRAAGGASRGSCSARPPPVPAAPGAPPARPRSGTGLAGRERSQGKGQGTCAAHVMDRGGQ